ncbi:hypothetical protein BV25DRAFT_1833942 [Artomyces pyxidatus]|uniref:Uncharacterized protein n=1 Tax=Artomyces pyxidatus TaxID=48021 RepID=A0ACB8TK10_9AGAM|nr:hypothetical protein BV25DRAFT_1833942 [Artomyces pyxidatus]
MHVSATLVTLALAAVQMLPAFAAPVLPESSLVDDDTLIIPPEVIHTISAFAARFSSVDDDTFVTSKFAHTFPTIAELVKEQKRTLAFVDKDIFGGADAPPVNIAAFHPLQKTFDGSSANSIGSKVDLAPVGTQKRKFAFVDKDIFGGPDAPPINIAALRELKEA